MHPVKVFPSTYGPGSIAMAIALECTVGTKKRALVSTVDSDDEFQRSLVSNTEARHRWKRNVFSFFQKLTIIMIWNREMVRLFVLMLKLTTVSNKKLFAYSILLQELTEKNKKEAASAKASTSKALRETRKRMKKEAISSTASTSEACFWKKQKHKPNHLIQQ